MNDQLNLKDLNFSDRVNLQNLQHSESVSSNSCLNTDESKANHFFQMNTLSSNKSLSITSSIQNNSTSNILNSSHRMDMNKSRFCREPPHSKGKFHKHSEQNHFRFPQKEAFKSEQSNPVTSTVVSTRQPASNNSNYLNLTIYSNMATPDVSGLAKSKKSSAKSNDKNGDNVRYNESGSDGDQSPASSQMNDFYAQETLGQGPFSHKSNAFFSTFNKQGTNGTKFVQSELDHGGENLFGLGKEKVLIESESPAQHELIDFNLSQDQSNKFGSSKAKLNRKVTDMNGSMLRDCDKMSLSYSTMLENFTKTPAAQGDSAKRVNTGASPLHSPEQFPQRVFRKVKEGDSGLHMKPIKEEHLAIAKHLHKNSLEKNSNTNLSLSKKVTRPPNLEAVRKVKAADQDMKSGSKQTLIYEDLPQFDSPDCHLKRKMEMRESPQSGSPCKNKQISRFRSNLKSSENKSDKKEARRSQPKGFGGADKENKQHADKDGAENRRNRAEKGGANITQFFNDVNRSMTEYEPKNYSNAKTTNFRGNSQNKRQAGTRRPEQTHSRQNPYKLDLKGVLDWSPAQKKKELQRKYESHETNLMKTVELNSELERPSRPDNPVKRSSSKRSRPTMSFESSETKNFRKSARRSSKYRYQPGSGLTSFGTSGKSSKQGTYPSWHSRRVNELSIGDNLTSGGKGLRRKTKKVSGNRLAQKNLSQMNSNSKKKLFTKKENKNEIMDFEIINTTQSKFREPGKPDTGRNQLTSQFNSKKLVRQLSKQIQLSKQNLSQKELITNLQSFKNIFKASKDHIGRLTRSQSELDKSQHRLGGLDSEALEPASRGHVLPLFPNSIPGRPIFDGLEPPRQHFGQIQCHQFVHGRLDQSGLGLRRGPVPARGSPAQAQAVESQVHGDLRRSLLGASI